MLVLNSILLPELYQNVIVQMRHCQYYYYINCTMKLIIMLISLLGVWGLLYLLSNKRLVQIYNKYIIHIEFGYCGDAAVLLSSHRYWHPGVFCINIRVRVSLG